MYASLLVGVASAFGRLVMVSSVRRMGKHMLKGFKEVSKVSNTSLNARIVGMMVSQDSYVFSLLC